MSTRAPLSAQGPPAQGPPAQGLAPQGPPAECDPAHGRPGPPRQRTAPGPRTRRTPWLRRLLLAATAVASALVLAVSATGYALVSWSSRSIERVDAFAGLTDRPPRNAGSTTTFLLVGSDGREGMTRAQQRALHVGTVRTAAGRRADTMLLVQVSPRRGRIEVVSLPRDSYVTIPEFRGEDGRRIREHRSKLNAAYAFGGPPLAVATVERSTGVRIDHYVEVDFLGFVRLVDALGGVDVCTPVRLRDRKAGLRLPRGTTHVDGETGLAYVRARSLDARADLGRVERQQRFLAAMAQRVTSRDVLLDPRALVRFLDAALSAVRADPGLSEAALTELGLELRHVSPGDIRFRTVPIANPSFRAPDGSAVAQWDAAAAADLFTALRTDRPVTRDRVPPARRPTVPPAQVRVQVYNGVGTPGLGTLASQELAHRGFDVAGPALDWRRSGVGRTTIRYDSDYTESIKTAAAALPGARLVPVDGLGRTLQVVLGRSYEGTRAVQVRAPQGADVRRTGDADGASMGKPLTAAADPCR